MSSVSKQRLFDKEAIIVADTTGKRALGLMFRKQPKPLVLVFRGEARHSIWMLFMRFPIDLVFLDSQHRVVTIHENIKPISFDPATWGIYRPSKPAKYALEVAAGWVAGSKIVEGDRLDLGLV